MGWESNLFLGPGPTLGPGFFSIYDLGFIFRLTNKKVNLKVVDQSFLKKNTMLLKFGDHFDVASLGTDGRLDALWSLESKKKDGWNSCSRWAQKPVINGVK